MAWWFNRPCHPIVIEREERVAFHMEEFKALKSELAENTNQTATNFRYAITTSGAIAAWLLSQRANQPLPLLRPEVWLTIASCIPLILSFSLGRATRTMNKRVELAGDYLTILEKQLGFPNLGWHQQMRLAGAARGESSLLSGWKLLLVGDAALVIYLNFQYIAGVMAWLGRAYMPHSGATQSSLFT